MSARDANVVLVCLGYPKIDRFPYAWPAQMWPVSLPPALVVTFTSWWTWHVGEWKVWCIIGHFRGDMHFTWDKILSEVWARISSVLFSVITNMTTSWGAYSIRTERLWLTMEEMGCLTDSQWAARILSYWIKLTAPSQPAAAFMQYRSFNTFELSHHLRNIKSLDSEESKKLSACMNCLCLLLLLLSIKWEQTRLDLRFYCEYNYESKSPDISNVIM